MARQTRQQRRERRAQQGEPALAGAGRPPAPPPPVANGGSQPAPRPAPRSSARRRGYLGTLVNFVQEAIAELKKVEWPSQKQVITGTTVVLIACIVVGAFLYVNDIAWKHVVHWLINV
jgi:preprotein translocase subunit SecE